MAFHGLSKVGLRKPIRLFKISPINIHREQTRSCRSSFPALDSCTSSQFRQKSSSNFDGPMDSLSAKIISDRVKQQAGMSDEGWKVLNEKVFTYPTTMRFTAIGSGGDEFVHAMVVAVESVVQCSIMKDDVCLSTKGRYVSVRIGPVTVYSSDQVHPERELWNVHPCDFDKDIEFLLLLFISTSQVMAIYKAMRKDKRMKYLL